MQPPHHHVINEHSDININLMPTVVTKELAEFKRSTYLRIDSHDRRVRMKSAVFLALVLVTLTTVFHPSEAGCRMCGDARAQCEAKDPGHEETATLCLKEFLSCMRWCRRTMGKRSVE